MKRTDMEHKETTKQLHRMTYRKFSLMMAISFIIMYAVMFLNVDDANHIYLSLNRTYMALLMVSPMAVAMMLMMAKCTPIRRQINGSLWPQLPCLLLPLWH